MDVHPSTVNESRVPRRGDVYLPCPRSWRFSKEPSVMLVLTRSTSEMIKIGENVTVMVIRTSHGKVTLGIDAPRDVSVMRVEGTLVKSSRCAVNQGD